MSTLISGEHRSLTNSCTKSAVDSSPSRLPNLSTSHSTKISSSIFRRRASSSGAGVLAPQPIGAVRCAAALAAPALRVSN